MLLAGVFFADKTQLQFSHQQKKGIFLQIGLTLFCLSLSHPPFLFIHSVVLVIAALRETKKCYRGQLLSSNEIKNGLN